MMRSNIVAGFFYGLVICCLWIHGFLYPRDKAEFYPGGSYLPEISTPQSVLGFAVGDRPARPAEILRYFRVLAGQSPRMTLVEAGQTHEGRALVYALISSEENMARLEPIRADIARLADPRRLRSPGEAEAIIQSTPAVAWMMYSIHGDELSGADAAVYLAYQLTAGNDSLTQKLLQNLVIGIDPMENPDGRERYLGMMQQWNGTIPNPDAQSVQHAGWWPRGRTNHYLFDLNRDWFILSQPESRTRVQALARWHPQLVVDAHEMEAESSFLFPPSREPINPHYAPVLLRWIEKFAEDDARAFDRYGWSYYHREWLEEWYPGYGSSLPMLHGAVAILYEQASTDGTLIKRPEGTILTFREAVHHQFVSSWANLTTAAQNRAALLRDFYRLKTQWLSPKKGETQAFYIVPGENPARAGRLVERLRLQGVEIGVAANDFTAANLRDARGASFPRRTLPAGTYVIPLNQPLAPLVRAVMDFDPRMKSAFLKWERETIEKGREETRLYEVSAWSMALAYDLEVYAAGPAPAGKITAPDSLKTGGGRVINPAASYGFIMDGRDDRSVLAGLRLLENGYTVRLKSEAAMIAGRHFPRGSLLLRKNENPADLPAALQKICAETGADAVGLSSARADSGSDPGGDENYLLAAPRIALLAGPHLDAYNIGAIWYLLDQELHARFSILPHPNFANTDLRKYNVLILPHSQGGPQAYPHILGKAGLEKIKTWVAEGGTLVGIDGGAAFLADTAAAISGVRLRRQALSRLHEFERAWAREQDIGKTAPDSLTIWEKPTPTGAESAAEQSEADTALLAALDQQQRAFQPRGAFLQVRLDTDHWLASGLREQVPALVYTEYAYLSRKPAETVGRFSEGGTLRLSGLLWPEARERWQHTAYLTREARGMGQIILFAGQPNFRSYTYGTGRLLINALVFGPGCGAPQPTPW